MSRCGQELGRIFDRIDWLLRIGDMLFSDESAVYNNKKQKKKNREKSEMRDEYSRAVHISNKLALVITSESKVSRFADALARFGAVTHDAVGSRYALVAHVTRPTWKKRETTNKNHHLIDSRAISGPGNYHNCTCSVHSNSNRRDNCSSCISSVRNDLNDRLSPNWGRQTLGLSPEKPVSGIGLWLPRRWRMRFRTGEELASRNNSFGEGNKYSQTESGSWSAADWTIISEVGLYLWSIDYSSAVAHTRISH